MIYKAYKYRLYPKGWQKEMFAKTFGCCRLVYNTALHLKTEVYRGHRISLSAFDLMKQLTEVKKCKEYEWLNEVDSQSLNQSLLNVDKAFKNFLKHDAGFPKYKRKNNRQKFNCPCNKREINWEKRTLTIPKIADIPIELTRRFPEDGVIKTVTIEKTPTNKYFASILVELPIKLPQPKPINKSVGIDMGIKTFATLSDKLTYPTINFISKYEHRLAFYHRCRSRKKKGSHKYRQYSLKINRIHEKITNQRRDYLHKVSSEITNLYDTIIVEDLATQNLSRRCKPKTDDDGKFIANGQSAKSGLNKAILNAGWGEFIRQLEYKSAWKGNNFITIGIFVPSSKTCSNCGEVKKELTLADREWDCHKCKQHNERDENAAMVIHAEGLRMITERNNIVNQKESGQGMSSEPVELRR